MIFRDIIIPSEESQAIQVNNLSSAILAMLENQPKADIVYHHDELLKKVCFF